MAVDNESGSGSASEAEDDERIMTLLTFAGKHKPEEIAEKLRELGGDDAIIYGDLVVGKPLHAMAFFLVMGAASLDEEKPLAPQLTEQRALFKAVFHGDEDFQAALLVILELFSFKERRASLDEFDAVLRVLWERDIVTQEVIEAWIENERALCEFWPKYFSQADAEQIRTTSRKFQQWLEEGEDE
eukprot:TRINITY_DN46394_c0_g1_i1.p1 TRINITY_DN46394_c0_g1~~TRINITY_DN46394_c0_g1_i1.p1  ORF type:complete len:186 (-),score=68.50 TRINITY_DN46394_c0_g1_i1:206-763(-)